MAAKNVYSMLMENDKVRVMALKLKPGEKAPMHNHPSDHVVYVMKDAKMKLTFADGKTADADLKAGQVVWMDAGSHEAENVGMGDAHNIVFEMKK